MIWLFERGDREKKDEQQKSKQFLTNAIVNLMEQSLHNVFAYELVRNERNEHTLQKKDQVSWDKAASDSEHQAKSKNVLIKNYSF